MSHEYSVSLRRRIAANLARHERHEIPAEEGMRAAVAITLVDRDGRAGYLFTRRALTLSRNPGQFALPGGRMEPGESATDAARRELAEELGVDLPETAVLGELDDLPTRSGTVVTPVVLWAAGTPELVPSADEVHAVWIISVSELEHPEAPRWVTVEGLDGQVLRMPVGGEWINPPTAAILYQFREVGLHGATVRVHEIPSPEWTAD
ncbi:MAG: NUDIX hydrolase [Acidimicrobiia bacterium]